MFVTRNQSTIRVSKCKHNSLEKHPSFLLHNEYKGCRDPFMKCLQNDEHFKKCYLVEGLTPPPCGLWFRTPRSTRLISPGLAFTSIRAWRSQESFVWVGITRYFSIWRAKWGTVVRDPNFFKQVSSHILCFRRRWLNTQHSHLFCETFRKLLCSG